MTPRVRSFVVNASTLLITALVVGGIVVSRMQGLPASAPQQSASAAGAIAPATSTPNLITLVGSAPASTTSLSASSSPITLKTARVASATVQKSKPITSSAASSTESSEGVAVARIQNPYSTSPESVDELNTQARAALVNILCMAPGGSIQSISGSGVIIDRRGIILTNAHVAQYVLLSENPEFNLSCTIRTGSPASDAWTAAVMYIPPIWVAEHAEEITETHPTGTGEHDYAFLRITGSVNQTPLPAGGFPYVPIDARDGIGFLGDQILVASYPAELVGPQATEENLYADSSVSTIQQLLTFATSSIDVISLGGVIEAQGGSSGGAVLNAWGYLIGLISTTSDAATTAQRDLRAITLSYIDRDLEAQSGMDLQTFLNQDPATQEQNFNATTAPGLINQYIQVLTKQQ